MTGGLTELPTIMVFSAAVNTRLSALRRRAGGEAAALRGRRVGRPRAGRPEDGPGPRAMAAQPAPLPAAGHRTGRCWSPEEEAWLRQALAAGRTNPEMAGALGRSVSAVAARLRRLRRRGQATAPEELRHAAA